jgi:hypothetical protein
MAARVHRPPKVIEFYANSTWRLHYDLSKQLQDLHINVALLSETSQTPYEVLYSKLLVSSD